MRVSILDGETEISRGNAPVATGRAQSVAPCRADPKLWSPEDPKLYDVTLEVVRNDQVIDRVHSYFGFRTVESHDGRVFLNGKPAVPEIHSGSGLLAGIDSDAAVG